MLRFCMLTYSAFTHVLFVYIESWISLCVSGAALITHGLAQLCQVGVCDLQSESKELRTRSGWEEGWGEDVCSGCTSVLVFVASTCAAVGSSPELLRGGWSREFFARGQQWGGGSSLEASSSSSSFSFSSSFCCVSSSCSSPASYAFSTEGLSSWSLLLSRCGQRRWWLVLERWGLLLPPGGARSLCSMTF